MPIRSRLTAPLALPLALAGALVAAGFPALAHAADIDGAPFGEADMRDLRPTPSRPGGGVGQRPRVTLRPSSPVVPVGAPISFELGTSVNGFGHIYVLSASGGVQVWMENVPIAAGQRLLFPIGGTGIEAASPPGREELMLIVTRERIDGFLGYEGTRTPRLLEYSHGPFKRALTAKFVDMPHRLWGYARTSVQVVERSGSAPPWGWPDGGTQRPADIWAGQWETD
jgi:hypothetical protein